MAVSSGGAAVAARGRLLLGVDGARALPGPVRALTASGDRDLHAVFSSGSSRAALQWTADGATWSPIAAPGDVRLLASDGQLVVAGADMLGRGRQGQFAWTPWPGAFRAEGLAVQGAIVVAWGAAPAAYGRGTALAVSVDGGQTLRVAPIEGRRLVWGVIDPWHPERPAVLVLDDEGTLWRIELAGRPT